MRAAFSGSEAGATIDVWKAWLTGSCITWWPASVSAAMARWTASVAPPMTAWLWLLMLAMTTLPSIPPTTRSTSARGANTAAMRPRSSMSMFAISRPRALTASRASSNGRAPAAVRAPYSPRLWPMTKSGRMP